MHREIHRQRRRGTVDVDAVVRCANGDVVLQQGVSVTMAGASGSVAMAMPSTPALRTRLPRNTVPATGPPGRGRRAAGAGDPRPDRAWRREGRTDPGGPSRLAASPSAPRAKPTKTSDKPCARVVWFRRPNEASCFACGRARARVCSPADGAQERVTNVCGRHAQRGAPRGQLRNQQRKRGQPRTPARRILSESRTDANAGDEVMHGKPGCVNPA